MQPYPFSPARECEGVWISAYKGAKAPVLLVVLHDCVSSHIWRSFGEAPQLYSDSRPMATPNAKSSVIQESSYLIAK